MLYIDRWRQNGIHLICRNTTLQRQSNINKISWKVVVSGKSYYDKFNGFWSRYWNWFMNFKVKKVRYLIFLIIFKRYGKIQLPHKQERRYLHVQEIRNQEGQHHGWTVSRYAKKVSNLHIIHRIANIGIRLSNW